MTINLKSFYFVMQEVDYEINKEIDADFILSIATSKEELIPYISGRNDIMVVCILTHINGVLTDEKIFTYDVGKDYIFSNIPDLDGDLATPGDFLVARDIYDDLHAFTYDKVNINGIINHKILENGDKLMNELIENGMYPDPDFIK